jgi:hypothetical protein
MTGLARQVLLNRVHELLRAHNDPAFLISHMKAPDEREASTFGFKHLRDESLKRWAWQRGFIAWLHSIQRGIVLKARQLGVTWLCCAYVVWTVLFRRGSLCLIYRQKEEEAQENVTRCWRLLHSLPKHLWNGAEVITPTKGAVAKSEIALRFPSGEISRILAMTSASVSGHGKTAAVVLLDEHSRIERASEIMKAVQPAAGTKGKIFLVSTANGLSSVDEHGYVQGNAFHHFWQNAEDAGFEKRFLAWDLHPDRDEDWYANSPEVRGLRSYERAEQYPANEHEAFTLTSNNFFDQDEITYYGSVVPELLYRFDFNRKDARHASLKRSSQGQIYVYREPRAETKYAIGVDVSSGTSFDKSAASVVDLGNMEIAAEFYGLIDPDLFAFTLHYLGKHYGTGSGCSRDSLIAVENQGGYGIPVVNSLRDGREGRPAYPNLYRHQMGHHVRLPTSLMYGFPMGTNNRQQVIAQIGKAVREGFESQGVIGLPYMSDLLLGEARSFLKGPLPGQRQTGTWPRAQDGSRDDLIMATAIALEMFRQRGEHPERQVKRRLKTKSTSWLPLGN